MPEISSIFSVVQCSTSKMDLYFPQFGNRKMHLWSGQVVLSFFIGLGQYSLVNQIENNFGTVM